LFDSKCAENTDRNRVHRAECDNQCHTLQIARVEEASSLLRFLDNCDVREMMTVAKLDANIEFQILEISTLSEELEAVGLLVFA